MVSDVVAKARLDRAEGRLLWFRALSYKKGNGPSTLFSVLIPTSTRDTQWDNEDAILFLVEHDGRGADFEFTDTAAGLYWGGGKDAMFPVPYRGDLPDGYTVDSNNPVWLPVSSDNTGAVGVSSDVNIITDYDESGSPETLTESDLEAILAWMAGTSRGVSGATENSVSDVDYKNCVDDAVLTIQAHRDREAYFGKNFEDVLEYEIASGTKRGTRVNHIPLIHPLGRRVDTQDVGYDSYVVFEDDARLFSTEVSDTDEVPGNGYSLSLKTNRPLPAGTYTFKTDLKPYIHTHCGFDFDGLASRRKVTVTKRVDTLHEALFDPASLSPGSIGFAVAPLTGLLDPRLIMATTSRTIQGLKWEDEEITLSLSPFGQLRDLQLEFIGLDGKVTLVLRTNTATKDRSAKTLTWNSPEQPWTAGDQLMLRIAPVPQPHPTMTLWIASAEDNSYVWFRWEPLNSIGNTPVTAYTIEWALTDYGPWSVVNSPGAGTRCLPRMSFNLEDEHACHLRYIDASMEPGHIYHFRLIAHAGAKDSLPSPSIPLRR